jgi:hypothetical protein
MKSVVQEDKCIGERGGSCKHTQYSTHYDTQRARKLALNARTWRVFHANLV